MKVFQSAFGWKAESFFPLDDTTRITITTMKRSNGLITTTVMASCKEGEMYYWTVCKDYSKTWGISKSIRATQKTVAEQQQTVLAQLDQIKFEVVAFYEQLRETT
jgi:hypothetical protein